jgi:hypothetical protein
MNPLDRFGTGGYFFHRARGFLIKIEANAIEEERNGGNQDVIPNVTV